MYSFIAMTRLLSSFKCFILPALAFRCIPTHIQRVTERPDKLHNFCLDRYFLNLIFHIIFRRKRCKYIIYNVYFFDTERNLTKFFFFSSSIPTQNLNLIKRLFQQSCLFYMIFKQIYSSVE